MTRSCDENPYFKRFWWVMFPVTVRVSSRLVVRTLSWVLQSNYCNTGVAATSPDQQSAIVRNLLIDQKIFERCSFKRRDFPKARHICCLDGPTLTLYSGEVAQGLHAFCWSMNLEPTDTGASFAWSLLKSFSLSESKKKTREMGGSSCMQGRVFWHPFGQRRDMPWLRSKRVWKATLALIVSALLSYFVSVVKQSQTFL